MKGKLQFFFNSGKLAEKPFMALQGNDIILDLSGTSSKWKMIKISFNYCLPYFPVISTPKRNQLTHKNIN